MDEEPQLPVAISYIGFKYLLFDIQAVTWLRRVHRICGVMSATLTQAPSQNIFLGLPVQIMPEEAQLLVERGVAYIVDDHQAHEHTLQENDASRNSMYMDQIRKKGIKVSLSRREENEEIKRQKMKQTKGKKKSKSKDQPDQSSDQSELQGLSPSQQDEADADDSLFDSTSTLRPNPSTTTDDIMPHGIIQTTSDPWLPTPTIIPSRSESQALLPNVPPSYALYKHLNDKSYYMTPGLRFGCQYSVYPGDPLRYHSHFLAVGFEWDQEIDLMSIVGGGRLGTGVKKGFLIGGAEPSVAGKGEEGSDGDRVRTFSIEWAAM